MKLCAHSWYQARNQGRGGNCPLEILKNIFSSSVQQPLKTVLPRTKRSAGWYDKGDFLWSHFIA